MEGTAINDKQAKIFKIKLAEFYTLLLNPKNKNKENRIIHFNGMCYQNKEFRRKQTQ